MKVFLLTLFVAAVAGRIFVTNEEWEEYKKKWGKSYPKDRDGLHKKYFENSVNAVSRCNKRYEAGKSHFKCKLNKRADAPRAGLFFPFAIGLDEHEMTWLLKWVNKFGTRETSKSNRTRRSVDYKDWSEEGAVTEVVEQGDCQACYAFAVTAAIESHNYIKTKKLVKLSEQQIVDCSKNIDNVTTSGFLNNGCQYGFTDHSFEYFTKFKHELNYAKDYPYKEKENGKCLFNPAKPKVKVPKYRIIKSASEEELKNIIATVGPVAAGIDILSKYFAAYSEGVYDSPHCDGTPDSVNHAVLIVGFGTTKDGIDYWKIKNSWGTDWGMNGYGLVRRNNNTCSIANHISYPILT